MITYRSSVLTAIHGDNTPKREVWDAICAEAGVDSNDEEITVYEVERDAVVHALADANKKPPRGGTFYAVAEAGQEWEPLFHVSASGEITRM